MTIERDEIELKNGVKMSDVRTVLVPASRNTLDKAPADQHRMAVWEYVIHTETYSRTGRVIVTWNSTTVSLDDSDAESFNNVYGYEFDLEAQFDGEGNVELFTTLPASSETWGFSAMRTLT